MLADFIFSELLVYLYNTDTKNSTHCMKYFWNRIEQMNSLQIHPETDMT